CCRAARPRSTFFPPETVGGRQRAWTPPPLVEICIAFEINGYLPAEFCPRRVCVGLNGATHRPRAWLGGGWRLSSMELSLPDMPFGMGGRRACAAAHPGEPCRQRRRRELAPDQRLPGFAAAGSAIEGAPSAQRNARN